MPVATVRDRAEIACVLMDRITRAQVVERVDEFVRSGEPHQIVTVNVDFLNIVRNDSSFATLLNAAALAVPDGMPLLWISRLSGRPLTERITGTDILLDCAQLAAQRGYRLFLLGAAPGIATQAAAVLCRRYPDLCIAGTYSPPQTAELDDDENAHIVQLIRAARPDILFVALGTPKQERWIYQHLNVLGVPVCVGVGGVFNFITGQMPRAPQAMQRLGLEWLFRLVCEPRRLWRRYIIDDTRALWGALAQTARSRLARAQPAPSAPAIEPEVYEALLEQTVYDSHHLRIDSV